MMKVNILFFLKLNLDNLRILMMKVIIVIFLC